MWIVIVLVVIVLAVVAFGVVGFNKLRTSDVSAQEALGGIDVQLTRQGRLETHPAAAVREATRWQALR